MKRNRPMNHCGDVLCLVKRGESDSSIACINEITCNFTQFCGWGLSMSFAHTVRHMATFSPSLSLSLSKVTQSKGFTRLMMADGQKRWSREEEGEEASTESREEGREKKLHWPGCGGSSLPLAFHVRCHFAFSLSVKLPLERKKSRASVSCSWLNSCRASLVSDILPGHFAHSSSSTALICHFLLSLSFFSHLSRPLFQLASLSLFPCADLSPLSPSFSCASLSLFFSRGSE